MAEPEPQRGPLRFGNFELDLRAGELRKAGVKLKLGGQPFQVLAILLEHPGEVVTREELQKQLWPDTFVNVDHNLNTAINKIREALGDSAESPRFVETLPRRGYRFVAPVKGNVPAPAESKPGPAPPRTWLKMGVGMLAVAAIALGAVGVYRRLRPQPQPTQEQANLTPVPFTALAGQATSPAFSPDGSRIAFAWKGDPTGGDKGFDLYVKAIGSETLLRLTQHPSDWISPTWSPDGTQIAFHRMAGSDTGIYLVPALGGPERKLRSTRMPWWQSSQISWSPDGKWIALADVPLGEDEERTYLLSTETLEIKQIPISPKCDRQGMPAFSHNGEHLAYWCAVNEEAELYSLILPDGEPKMIAPLRTNPIDLTWSADDKRLIYSFCPYANEASCEIGEVDVASGSTKRLTLAGSAKLPTVSPRGDKLAYSSLSNSSNIWRRDLFRPEAPAVQLMPSSRKQWGAHYSPNGKRIAFQSVRSGVLGAWISDDDGSNLLQISNPARPSGSPQWSPDGNKIAFDSLSREDSWEIYMADLAERVPRKLVTNLSNISRPVWSRDGKWIYFRSDQVGRAGIYRCPASGGDATPISNNPYGTSPQESFDGKTLYFASHNENSTLKQVALPEQPGTESDVEGLPRLRNYSLWTLTPGGIYFVPAEAPRSVRYFDIATGHIRPVFEADRDFVRGLSVSPDGRWILYSQAADASGDIILVEHFH